MNYLTGLILKGWCRGKNVFSERMRDSCDCRSAEHINFLCKNIQCRRNESFFILHWKLRRKEGGMFVKFTYRVDEASKDIALKEIHEAVEKFVESKNIIPWFNFYSMSVFLVKVSITSKGFIVQRMLLAEVNV